MNEEARHKVEQRQRTPALAFLVGALLVGALAVAVYLFWPKRAETPTTPAEAVATDDLDLPAPDAEAVRRQVDAALSQPATGSVPAGEAPSGPDTPVSAPTAPPETGARDPNDPPPPLPQNNQQP